jgi:putative RecB family exonuclease
MDSRQQLLPGVDVVRQTMASPSALEKYRHCPRLYRFLYVDGLWQYSRSTPQQAFGTSMHAALRDFFRLPVPQRSLEKLLELFKKAWRREGGGSAKGAKDDRARGLEALARWHERADTTVVPHATEVALTARFGEVTLKGRLDRIDRVPGGLRVVDYKTGVRPVTQETADADIALTIYAALVTRRLGQPVAELVLDYVVAGKAIVTTRPPEVLDARLGEVLRLAGDLRSDTTFQPRTGPWCARCDLLSRCEDGRDRVAALQAQEEPV